MQKVDIVSICKPWRNNCEVKDDDFLDGRQPEMCTAGKLISAGKSVKLMHVRC